MRWGGFFVCMIMGLTLLGCAGSPQYTKNRPATQPQALSQNPSHPRSTLVSQAEKLFQKGLQAYKNGNYDQARTFWDNAVRILILNRPSPEEQERTETLLQDIFEYSLEVDRILATIGNENDTEPAFINAIEDITLILDHTAASKLDVDWSSLNLSSDLPIVVNQYVVRMIQAYQTTRRREFERGLSRMPYYLDLYKSMFRNAGLPEDLAYLALIESGFNYRAYSRARARGIWQFIYSTGRKYGLRINWWLDERGDFIRSAEAAIQYLKELYTQFQDWWLVLAAYNAGEGRIARTLQRTGSKNFWDLLKSGKLPRETRNYVPAFLAALIIAKNPEAFGFTPSEKTPLSWKTVTIKGGVSLRTIARVTGIPYETLKMLNGGLRRGYIPPGINYKLRVPAETDDTLFARLEKLPRHQASDTIVHRIRRGETLYRLSRRYGVPLHVLLEVNHLSKRSILRIGQKIYIPVLRYRSRRTSQKHMARSLRKSRKRFQSHNGYHIVRKGETLHSIARRYGTSVNMLRKYNPSVHPRRLKVGQKLRIPKSNSRTEQKWSSNVHVVKKGETLFQISRQHQVPLSKLLRYNKLTKNSLIRPGDKIYIPPKEDYNENIRTSSR